MKRMMTTYHFRNKNFHAKCSKDTIIEFVEEDLSHERSVINSCCPEFDEKIQNKIWPNRS